MMLIPVRVATPRQAPHRDAGRLRVLPAGPSRPLGAAQDAPVAAPAVPAADEPAPAAQTEQHTPDRTDQGVTSHWNGAKPAGRVALRLGSGRVRSTSVRYIDGTGALVLGLAAPASLATGTEIDVAWSERNDWFTASLAVTDAQPAGHRDAGLLRLVAVAPPVQESNRRHERRFAIAIQVRGKVEKAAAEPKGFAFRGTTDDISLTGVNVRCSLNLGVGDTALIALIGPNGQIAPEVTARVMRATAVPASHDRLLGMRFEGKAPALTVALRKLFASAS
jgi:PilZ domain